MFKDLGFSLYVSAFARQKQALEALSGTGILVFTSFHIQEEYDQNYISTAVFMCQWLRDTGFRIMGDVSPKTLQLFGHKDILGFAREMGLSFLRLDYGFSVAETLAVSRQFPIAFNASTVDTDTAKEIVKAGGEVYAVHNFYPRPETGLAPQQFTNINETLSQLGLKVLAFIPGDMDKRGPIHEGLPTVEVHRVIPPYLAYLDMTVNYHLGGVLLGDIGLSSRQRQLIQDYCRTGVIAVPAHLSPHYHYLYDQTFTIRPDSPLSVKRLQESREYSCPGAQVEPQNCTPRVAGSITMDNQLYARYSGEIQILTQDLPQDSRVNVMGKVAPGYEKILDCLPNRRKIKLVKSGAVGQE